MSDAPTPDGGKILIAVKTFQAFEPVVAGELKELGFSDPVEETRLVSVEGTYDDVYRLNYVMRTALRILVPIKKFIVHSSDDLYRKVKKTDWSEWLGTDSTFAIDPHVSSSLFRHPHFASLRMKDAIADQFTERFQKRPDVDTESPDVRFDLHIDAGNRVTISLDSSGTSLNQRGYRITGGEAPLNEVLAAGMLKMAGYTGDQDLYIPMCGSGTLAVEAAMMSTRKPAQVLNPTFGFMSWKNFDQPLWKRVKTEADAAYRPTPAKIMASDLKPTAVEDSMRNLRQARLNEQVHVVNEDFFKQLPSGDHGLVVLNPPYGERLPVEAMQAFYKQMGDHLKRHWAGHTVWIISSNLEALKHFGLKPSAKFRLLNGNLPCLYQKFELFRGDRRTKLSQQSHPGSTHD